MVETAVDVIDILSRMSLFADLTRSQIEAATHDFDEIAVEPGDRLLRKGFAGTGFHVILSGEATVQVDGEVGRTLGRGDFFGEASVLLDEPATADVVAVTALRCLVLPQPEMERFLLTYPKVMYRLLRGVTQRMAHPLDLHG